MHFPANYLLISSRSIHVSADSIFNFKLKFASFRMSENGDVLMSTNENNEESIPVDQRSIKVTISSNLDPIVFEIAGDDNVDFIKQNILAGMFLPVHLSVNLTFRA